MTSKDFIKNYPEMIAGQTKKARADMEKISLHLTRLSQNMDELAGCEIKITQKIKDTLSVADDFKDRLRQASEHLLRSKSFLASFHS